MNCPAICKLLQNLKIHEEYLCNPRKINIMSDKEELPDTKDEEELPDNLNKV